LIDATVRNVLAPLIMNPLRSALTLAVALLVVHGAHRAHGAQSKVRIAMLDVALYNVNANLKEATDSARARDATERLRVDLDTAHGIELVDSARVAVAISSPAAAEAATGRPCGGVVACALAVGRATGAEWVVMAKVSKTSNLIWLLTGQLINVATGEIVIDDSMELKGDPERMVPAGTNIFASRVARRARGEQVSGAR
jgi:Protein of unknown function (DUF2380)